MAFCVPCALAWVAVAAAAYFVITKYFKCCSKKTKIYKEDWKKDTVYLYQFPRAQKLANLSPFCMKVEMFLRINNIPYENCFSNKRSKYGLLPFIELNGVQYADSQLIVETLKEKFDVKPLSDPREEAFARSLDRMVDGHTFALIIKYKSLDRLTEFVTLVLNVIHIPSFLFPLALPLFKFIFKRKIESRVFTMLGPFSEEEFHSLLKKDLDTLKAVLGDKKFLMGDEPTAVDCTVFGQFAQICYLDMDSEVKRMVSAEYPTIQQYLDRVVAKVFPAEFA